MNENLLDKDLARIFENAFPNTLDTTVRWHVDGSDDTVAKSKKRRKSTAYVDEETWPGAQSFIVTGDINAEWLRDSTNQLAQYQSLANKDRGIENLILGAINTQAEYVIESPYCNAFQPPPPSGLAPSNNGQTDNVHPAYEPNFVFECKYELDSLAAFLKIGNAFYESTGNAAFLSKRWFIALDTLIDTIDAQSLPTFDAKTGDFFRNEYTFTRETRAGTETLPLGGLGNPLNSGTGLIRSAFRPSDDATIFGYFIPANAMMAIELKRTGAMLTKAGYPHAGKEIAARGTKLEEAVWEHGVVAHRVHGDVFAFEVDGYGSYVLMDDANLPSLLSLPLLGFTTRTNPVYKNTRKMVLSRSGNPYYLTGSDFRGIGGPHIGLEHAWPMSVLVQAMTSDDDDEIMECLGRVKNVSMLGLIHESVNVNSRRDYTRSWFAWANSVFAQTVLDLAERRPALLFGKGRDAYVIR
jgi:meiotically up-regulated gene 157 (Mug157) protein